MVSQAPVFKMIHMVKSFNDAGVMGHSDHRGLVFPGNLL